MGRTISQNSELLFLYDAKMCNPNGDPDTENQPRMDSVRERCLVSDVRLKRYLRDYWEDRNYTLYVTKAEGVKTAGDRLREVLGTNRQPEESDLPVLVEKLIDVRFFGATMPIRGEGGRRGEGRSFSLTGPVQFNWGYSLNRVQMVESSAISSQLASEEGALQGTFGRDPRLYYALIAFHGIVSASRARVYERKNLPALSEEDLKLLDDAILRAIPLLATRSKIGQYPRLYLRFVFQDDQTFMGDPREDLCLDRDSDLRSVKDFTLDLTGMAPRIRRVAEQLARVLVWQHPDLKTVVDGHEVDCASWLGEIIGGDRVAVLPG